jgi:hypothetical protein
MAKYSPTDPPLNSSGCAPYPIASAPYILDLTRRAASAVLAPALQRMSLKTICGHVLDGYREGLAAPRACVLDRDHLWLRARHVVPEKTRAEFWSKIEKQHRMRLAKRKPEPPGKPWLELFAHALPEPAVELVYWQRTAGTGSFRRPRRRQRTLGLSDRPSLP